MSSGRGWVAVSMVSGLIAIVLFAAILLASRGTVVTTTAAVPQATPGQPVDTPFIYTRESVARPAASQHASAAPAATSQGSVSSSASDNNAAPDVSAQPNPFTAGIK
jgi:hypothetical protein